MIERVDNTNILIAKKILEISVEAYKVEAEIINYHNFPPLFESVGDIESSESRYFGYFSHGIIVGIIEISSSNNDAWINRLVVNPPYFRQGIATKLLHYILSGVKICRIGTAQNNTPAINLYEKMGFTFEQIKELGSPAISWVVYKYVNI